MTRLAPLAAILALRATAPAAIVRASVRSGKVTSFVLWIGATGE